MPKPDTPPPVTETPNVTVTPEDAFASAFTEAVNADVPATPDAPVAAAPEPAPEPVAEPDPVAEEPAPEPEPEPEPEEEPPEARMARLEAENAALRAPKPAPATPQPEAPEVAPQAPEGASKGPPEAPTASAAPPEPVWYQPSDDEKAILTDLEKNWPDIATAQQVAIKQAVYNAVQYTFNQIQRTYNPAIQRFAELSDVIAEQLALSALRGEHEDYDEVYEKVVSWVETLPVAFKLGAKQTMAQGTPEEVAELISEYKRTNSATAPGGAAPLAAPQRKTELSAAAKQAASKLRVVGSKRTTPVVAADPNDFNAAWSEAISSGS